MREEHPVTENIKPLKTISRHQRARPVVGVTCGHWTVDTVVFPGDVWVVDVRNVYAGLLTYTARQNQQQRLTDKTDREPVMKQIKRRKWICHGPTLRRNDAALSNKLCGGHCEATEEEGDQWTPGEEIRSQNWAQHDSVATGERSIRRLLEIEMDGEKWKSSLWSMLHWELQGIS